MDMISTLPDIFSGTVTIAGYSIFQSIIGGLMGTAVFVLFILIYYFLKKKNPYYGLVQGFERLFELIYKMFESVGSGKLGPKALTFTSTLFIFVLWHNLFGLVGDMIVMVWPAAHHVFRPMTTDIVANGTLAVIAVVLALAYGFSLHGFGFVQKYIPIHGMGLVPKITHRYDYITKFFDILLGLLIGIIEFLGEFGRMLSLSLRLFGNMFVGMILLTMLLYLTQSLIHIPLIAPLVIFAYEFAVSFIQAFIFALLTVVYFRLAADGAGH